MREPGRGTGAFWTHSSDDIYHGVVVAALASSTVISDKPLDVPNACADERNQPMSLVPIERTLHPTETQRARLDALVMFNGGIWVRSGARAPRSTAR
jgi:hypothetical protein